MPHGYTMITPFLGVVPREQRAGERINAGDGFIRSAIGRLLAPIQEAAVFSSRLPLTEEQIERINATHFAVLGGANQLKNEYTIVPGMTPQLFEKIRVPVIPFGIGWKERPRDSWKMSDTTLRLLEMMHERLDYSSWRCPHTHGYLLQNLPGIADKALMTGCPVQFQQPLLDGISFTAPRDHIVVTATDHGKFWEREKAILEFVAREFPKARRTLSLHQDGLAVKYRWKVKHLWAPPRRAHQLHALARTLGFELFYSEDPAAYVEKYRDVDGHFGSRLHAHLFLLGHGKASYLVRVDDRAPGFAESSDFPLFDPATFDGYKTYDFERYRRRVLELRHTMDKFLDSLFRRAGQDRPVAAAIA